jgi:putative ABC transport system permease protein
MSSMFCHNILLAIPLSSGLANALGQASLQTPLSYEFSVEDAALWLLLVIILASLASFLPARRNSQLTVREVLAYE